VSEERGHYAAEDEQVILARLLEVFTPGQLLHLAEAMAEAQARHYGRVEIEMRNGRLFIWAGASRDCGKAKRREPIA
jgi:hypothetical protein